jgi:uncharacterized protein (DUF305 family)
LAEWAKYEFKIWVKITDASFAGSIVYFCHIHNKMSGLMTVAGGSGSQVKNLYTPTVLSTFDQTCGTANSSLFSTQYAEYCPQLVFLCGAHTSDFAECMKAIDCRMNYQMKVKNIDTNNVATFMHQMIPHHTNAVNMARVLLKKTPQYGDSSLNVDIAESAAGEHDGFQDMLLEMINVQNYQVSEMRKWLLENNFKESGSQCTMPSTTTTGATTATGEPSTGVSSQPRMYSLPPIFVMVIVALAIKS